MPRWRNVGFFPVLHTCIMAVVLVKKIRTLSRPRRVSQRDNAGVPMVRTAKSAATTSASGVLGETCVSWSVLVWGRRCPTPPDKRAHQRCCAHCVCTPRSPRPHTDGSQLRLWRLLPKRPLSSTAYAQHSTSCGATSCRNANPTSSQGKPNDQCHEASRTGRAARNTITASALRPSNSSTR